MSEEKIVVLTIRATTEGLDQAKAALQAVGTQFEQTDRTVNAKTSSLDRLVQKFSDVYRIEQQYIAQQAQLHRATQAYIDKGGDATRANELHALGIAGLAQKYEAATRSAANITAAMGATTGVAKLQSHQILQLSQQFQDFGIQVAGGQNALIAFAQQGSQISYLLGGFGNTFRLAASAIFGVWGAAIGLAGGLALVVSRVLDLQGESRAFAVSLQAGGRAAELTTGQLHAQVEALRDHHVGMDEARAAVDGFVRSSAKVDSGLLGRLVQFAPDFARGIGRSVPDAMRLLTETAGQGFQAIVKLDDQFDVLTTSERQQVRQLAEHGQQAQALDIALAALERRFGGLNDLALSPAAKAFGNLGRAWDDLVTSIAESEPFVQLAGILAKDLEAIAGFLAKPSPEAQLASDVVAASRKAIEAEDELAGARARDDGSKLSEGLILELEGRARRLNETLDALLEKARQVASAAPSTTGGASNDSAGISRTDQKYIDDATAAYERQHRVLTANVADRALVSAAIKAEDEALKAALGPAAAERLKTLRQKEILDQRQAAGRDMITLSDEEAAAADRLAAAQALGAGEVAKVTAENKALALVLAGTINATERGAVANALASKAAHEAVAAQAERNRTLAEGNADLQRLLDAEGKGAAAVAEVARQNDVARQARDLRAKAEADGSDQAIALAERQIALLDTETRRQLELTLAIQNKKALLGKTDELDLAQKELSLLGETAQVRERALEHLRAEQDLRRRGIDLLSEEGQSYLTLADRIGATKGEIERVREAQQAWGRVAEDMTTKFIDGIEAGKFSLASLGDLFRDIAKQMILRPIVLPIVQQAFGVPVTQQASPFAPFQAAQQASSSLSFLSNPISSLSNLFSPNNFIASAFPSLFGTSFAGAVPASALLGPGGVAMAGAGATGAVAAPLAGLAPFLPALAIALPLLLGSLFSKRPSVGPNANATVGWHDGGLGIVDSGADNGGDRKVATDLAGDAIKALYKTIHELGGSLTSLKDGLQVGYFKGKLFVDDTRLGGTARYDQNQFDNAQDALADFVTRALKNADISGISETMKTALKNSTAKSFEDLGKNIDFAHLYERNFKAADQMAEAIKTLGKTFEDYAEQAKALGLDVGKVTDAFIRERQKLTAEFEKAAVTGILGTVYPAVANFLALMDVQKKRLDDAATLGASIVAVERLNYLERRSFILSLGEEQKKLFLGLLPLIEQVQLKLADAMLTASAGILKTVSALQSAHDATLAAANSFRSLGTSLRQAQDAMKIGNLSPLSPGDKLAEARRQFEDLAARAGQGDQGAASRLAAAGQSYLEIGQQNYASGPQYAAIYDRVQAVLGDVAVIQDAIALRLDIVVALMGSEIDVLKAIQKVLEDNRNTQSSVDALSRLGVAGDVSAYEQAVYRAIVDDLKSKLPATDPLQDKLGQLRGTADDGRISVEEAATSRGTLDELRLHFLTDLQGQLGSTSPLISAFNLLNTAMLTASTGAATLGTAVDRMGQVYVQLAALLPAGTIANRDDIGRVATNLAALIAAVAGPEAVTGIPAIGNLKTSLEGLGTALRNHEGAFSGELLGHIGLGLEAVGIALDTLSGVAIDPARIAAATTALSAFLRNGLAPAASPVTAAAFETVKVGLGILTGSVLGAASLTEGIPSAVANLNDATHGMPALTRILGTPIPSLQGLIDKFGELSLPDGSGPIATMKTAMDALKLAMTDPSSGLIKALADLNTWIATVIRTITGNTGPTNPAMPSIDRSPLTGDTFSRFQTLAGRAIGFASAAHGAGFTDQQVNSSDAWAWAVQQRQAIIGAATDTSALEQILSTYYGGTHTRTAYAGTDQGINEILDRIAAIGGNTNPTTGMAAAYRAYLADHPVRTGSEDQGYQTYVAAPDSQDAFNIAHWLGSPSPGAPTQVPWYDAWARWWSAGHVMADIDRFALGGVLNGPTYFIQGNGRIGVGGEAGSEGLFPLARTAGGQLGVRAVNDNGGVLSLQEARDLRAQVVRLTAINLRIADSLDRYRAEQAERDETAARKGDRRTTRDRLLGGTGRG